MDPGKNTKQISQDRGFYEGGTDEHRSLPHFSFLLFMVDVVLDLWNLRIPFVVRIHLNLSQQQPLYSSLSLSLSLHLVGHCGCHAAVKRSRLHTLNNNLHLNVSKQLTSLNLFSRAFSMCFVLAFYPWNLLTLSLFSNCLPCLYMNLQKMFGT